MTQYVNKTAVVIGGTSGIGSATVRFLLQDGVVVHVVGRSTGNMPEEKNLIKHRTDISNILEVEKLISQLNKIDKVDYLVNASGIFSPKTFLEHSIEDYNSYLDLNRGFFFITQAIAQKMKHTGGGSIVNVGSMWARQAIKATPSSAYSMQKAGLHSLTQHLAMELADFNIRVNAVSPAVVNTPVYHAVFGGKTEAEKALEGFNGFHPLGRTGSAEEIAESICFLLSEKASWITGTILDIDGGVMAGRN